MSDWIIDLGTQLYGDRHFAVHNSVGSRFWNLAGEDHWCCWRAFEDDYRTEYKRLSGWRAHLRMSPWAGGTPDNRPVADWIPNDCGTHSSESEPTTNPDASHEPDHA